MWALPILSWLLSALLLVRRGLEWRASFLAAAVIWGCLVTAFTEFLSFFDLLTTGGLALCWGIAAGITLLLNFNLKRPWQVRGKYHFSPLETGLFGGVALICLATFITAILAPPNTWDSMTYHMSRVMHWLQNRSVDHYPTHILRQIEMNPWAEFAIAHFQALSGGDRYANLVQWFSMAGSLVGVTLIAEQLGGDRRAQLWAAVVAATVPMGILQSSSTQNDYVVAFWMVCFVWSGLRFMGDKELKWAVTTGTSLGLAILAKGTAYLYAIPYAVWLAITLFRKAPKQAGLVVLCIVFPLILLNVGHCQRNLKVFSNPLTSGEHRFTNEKISGGVLVSNLLRNTALQLSSPFGGLNQFVKNGVAKIHEGWDIDINDPKTTWLDEKFRVEMLNQHEDTSGNFLHVALTIAVLFTLFSSRSFRIIYPKVSSYVVAIVAGFFLFCLLLKWQPWHSRLLLPLFVLGAPAAGVIAVKCWRPAFVNLTALVLLAAALPFAFGNTSRPLVHVSKEAGVMFPLLAVERGQLYFASRRNLDYYERYVQIAADIRRSGATNIGLITSENGWEYPLWVLIKEGNPTPVRIEHVEVNNASRLARTSDFKPDYYVRLE